MKSWSVGVISSSGREIESKAKQNQLRKVHALSRAQHRPNSSYLALFRRSLRLMQAAEASSCSPIGNLGSMSGGWSNNFKVCVRELQEENLLLGAV
jgi:hypothetical protein